MIKSHINEHYADDAFKERYKGFQPLLDYLIEYFFPLPTEIKGIYSEKALLQGKSDDVIHIYESLKAEITTLGKSITIYPLKHYIVLRNKEAQNILSIEIQSKKVLLYINKKKGTLVDKDSLTLDVSNKGHLGNGDYKIEITSIDRIKPVIDFLNKEVFNNI